jgi:hypothetical protein
MLRDINQPVRNEERYNKHKERYNKHKERYNKHNKYHTKMTRSWNTL